MNSVNQRSIISSSVLTALMACLWVGCESPKGPPPGNFPPEAATGPAASNLPEGQGLTNTPPAALTRSASPRPDFVTLREGDTLRITFPGSPNLNTSQQIRRDGKISLPMIGEVKAAGLTPSDLEKELVKLYAPQLVTKEVNVTLESSAYFVFVTGAVSRPGRIMFDRPISLLEAVIDAGVDYSKANLKHITVIRQQPGREPHYYHFNLKKELQGVGSEPFYLQPSDIVFVRERFTWF